MWKRARELLGKPRLVPVLCIGSSLAASTALVARGALRLRQKPMPFASARGASVPGSSGSDTREPQDAERLAQQVLERNIFDSTTGPLAWSDKEELVQPEDEPTQAPLSASEPCTDTLRLVASIVNARDPERSFAGLRKDGKTHIVALGGSLDDLTLAALYPTHGYFQRQGGGLCVLPVYLSANATPPPPPPPPPPPEPAPAAEQAAPGRKPPAFSEEELRKHIRVLGPAHYAVTKELFLRARRNPSGISRGTRFVARMDEGRPTGMEIIKIRQDSLLSHLGLQQGDVVRRLNGFNLGTPDGVLEAFGHMSKQDRLSLSIERNGVAQTIRYVLE